MSKTNIGVQGFVYPMPMVIVGSVVDGKPNFMPLAWITRARHTPPALVVTMGKTHVTNEGIREHGEFSVNVPSRSMMVRTDYAGLVSARRVDKSELFETFAGELEFAPMIAECPLTMECRVSQTVDTGSHELFIGDIAGTWVEEHVMFDGTPDVVEIDPFMLTMPDNRYWRLGDQVGWAWSDGRSYQLEEEPADEQ